MSANKIKRTTLFALGGLSILLGVALVAAKVYPAQTPEYGVSFSTKYAEELGVEPEQTLEATLNQLEFKRVRLMSYWDLHEPERGEYDFSSLDRQFDIAEKYGAEVLLAIGQRQPRWPECHVPGWAANLNEMEYRLALLNYLEAVAEHFKSREILGGYHLENEAANSSFGHCPELDSRFLLQEYELVKSVDPDTPITLSVSNQYGIPLRQPVGDKHAMSIYRQAYFELFDRQVYWNYSFVPAEWHRLRVWMINLIHGVDAYVHELQTEPWGPDPTVELTIEQQEKYMNTERLAQNVDYADSIGTEAVYLWGAEWWYWRLTRFDDPTLWSEVKQLNNDS